MESKEIKLPSIKELGLDLTQLSFSQKLWTIIKPFFFFFFFFVCAFNNFWYLATLNVIILMFVTYVSTSHDYVHKSLRINPKLNEILLSITELLVLRSGHAFKYSHINHHKYFPDKKDFEGKSIFDPLWKIIILSPFYTLSIYFWSLRNSKKYNRIIILEGILILSYIIFALSISPLSNVFIIYFLMTFIGGWSYPIFTVYIPHLIDFSHPIFQTIKFRGRIISFFFANHNYHLEHHLYPMVPHQNWKELANRLDPYLKNYNIKTIEF